MSQLGGMLNIQRPALPPLSPAMHRCIVGEATNSGSLLLLL